jgi:hypothetical protein
MFNFSLNDVLQLYPQLKYYLYEVEVPGVGPGIGKCCGRPELWQVLRVPILVWLRTTGREFDYVWLIEDDVDMFYRGISVLTDFIVETDNFATNDQYDILGFPQRGCPSWWHKLRHTPNFELIIDRMDLKRIKWTCIADYLQRLSEKYLDAHEENIMNYTFSFGETMIQPEAFNSNLSIKLFAASNLEWNGIQKMTQNDAIALSRNKSKRFFVHMKN